MINKITLKQIKSYLEKESGISDIGLKSRDRDISDLRKSFCMLARLFTKSSYAKIGLAIRPDFRHDSVIYNIKKFNELYPYGDLKCEKIYNNAHDYFSTIYGTNPTSVDLEGLKREYSQRINHVVEKFLDEIESRDRTIRQQNEKILKLKYKLSIVDKVIFSKK